MAPGSNRRRLIECRVTDKGAEYRGSVSVTRSGHTCQQWSDHVPHLHSYNDHFLFPDRNITAAGSKCRNPGGIKDAPWCFTLTRSKRWEFCDIPLCGCKATKSGRDYSGTVSTTVSGRRCQRWDSQTPNAHTYLDPAAFPDPSIEEAHAYCRNPDPWETMGPWCFTEDSHTRWEYCYVPFCECKLSRQGSEYGGKISITVTGKVCQRWDTEIPHKHRYYDPCQFPEDSVAEAANFCRAPEPNEPEGPWCYTTDPDTRWEYCSVPVCENRTEEAELNNGEGLPGQGLNERILQGRGDIPGVTGAPGRSSSSPSPSSHMDVHPSFLIGMLISCLVLLILIFLVALYAARRSHKNSKDGNSRGTPAAKDQESFENPTYLEKALENQHSGVRQQARPLIGMDDRYVAPGEANSPSHRQDKSLTYQEHRYASPGEVEPRYINEARTLLSSPRKTRDKSNCDELLGTKYVFSTPEVELQEEFTREKVGRDSPIYMNISSTNVSSL